MHTDFDGVVVGLIRFSMSLVSAFVVALIYLLNKSEILNIQSHIIILILVISIVTNYLAERMGVIQYTNILNIIRAITYLCAFTFSGALVGSILGLNGYVASMAFNLILSIVLL